MSDFAFQYFKSELDNLALPKLSQIYDKVKSLISAKSGDKSVPFTRELGGLEDGFYIAPDFNETPDCLWSICELHTRHKHSYIFSAKAFLAFNMFFLLSKAQF